MSKDVIVLPAPAKEDAVKNHISAGLETAGSETVLNLTREQMEAAAKAAKPMTVKEAQREVKKEYSRALQLAKEMGIEKPRTVLGYVPIEVFLSLRPFPFNRDVAKRLTAKKNTHLKGEIISAQQTKVALCLTDNNNCAELYDKNQPMMILDGNSRQASWKAGKLAKPSHVMVEFFTPMTDAQIDYEYEVFTNSKAKATAGEEADHVNKKSGWNPVSEFCKSSWKNSFAICGASNYEEGLETYREALNLVESWNITPEKGVNSTRRHTSGIKAALLETWETAEGEELQVWEKFWKDFFNPSYYPEVKFADADKVKELIELEATRKPEHQGFPFRNFITIQQAFDLAVFCRTNKGSGSALDNKIKKEAVKKYNAFVKAEAKK